MNIVYMISNFIYSAFNLLVLIVLYVDRFGTGSIPEFLLNVLDKIAYQFFSEYNMIGNLITCIICIFFVVLTVAFLIKNLIKKQNVLSLVLSVISIVSMIGFSGLWYKLSQAHTFLTADDFDNPIKLGLVKAFFIFNMVIVAGQFIAAVINEIIICREKN